jgi:alpha-beta hydrolase superfamily lysophospholipase
MICTVALLAVPPHASATEYVCSWWKEWLGYWSLSSMAGQPVPRHFEGLVKDHDYEEISKPAEDGTSLKGYKLRAASGQKHGAVFAVQGNAQLASYLLQDMRSIAGKGFDVIAYDFRGYGISTAGSPSFKAIVDDYRMLLADFLRLSEYKKKYVYGMSFGGVVALNALTGREPLDLLMLDAVPATLDEFGCPSRYHPANRLKMMKMKVGLLVGIQDTVVRPEKQAAMIATVRANANWILKQDAMLHHPFTPEVDQSARLKVLNEVFVP